MTYLIEECPVACQRARRNGSRYYDAQTELKDRWRWILKTQHKGELYAGVALAIHIVFYMPIPASLSAKQKLALDGCWHIKKPDRDNLEKLLYDVCTGVVVKDDCIFAVGSSKKVYSTRPRIEFSVEKL